MVVCDLELILCRDLLNRGQSRLTTPELRHLTIKLTQILAVVRIYSARTSANQDLMADCRHTVFIDLIVAEKDFFSLILIAAWVDAVVEDAFFHHLGC